MERCHDDSWMLTDSLFIEHDVERENDNHVVDLHVEAFLTHYPSPRPVQKSLQAAFRSPSLQNSSLPYKLSSKIHGGHDWKEWF